jgi:O-acetyl-ADP-ribose deacetylase (regulator of RNase III)/uncharacterized protein YwgA
MVTVKVGNLFDSEAQTLVNTVNCVGVMGKGIALEFKDRFPEMFKDYVAKCSAGQVKLGQPYLYRSLLPPWVLNFPTKDNWRSASRLKDIEDGLRYLLDHYQEWSIKSLAVPPLGCGYGQLEWRVVGPTLYRFLKQFNIPVELFAPSGTTPDELDPEFLDETSQYVAKGNATSLRVPPGLIAVVEVLQRLEREPPSPPVGRVAFQKIIYFATQCGIPTGLRYERGVYGPHATGLNRQITTLLNNGLIREERLGRMVAVRVGSTFTDASRVFEKQLDSWKDAIERLVVLFRSLNTEQAELVATVHFVSGEFRATKNLEPTESNVIRGVMGWEQKRRRPLDAKEVSHAIEILSALGWISTAARYDAIFSKEEPPNE